jgi:hypothetical protein
MLQRSHISEYWHWVWSDENYFLFSVLVCWMLHMTKWAYHHGFLIVSMRVNWTLSEFIYLEFVADHIKISKSSVELMIMFHGRHAPSRALNHTVDICIRHQNVHFLINVGTDYYQILWLCSNCDYIILFVNTIKPNAFFFILYTSVIAFYRPVFEGKLYAPFFLCSF